MDQLTVGLHCLPRQRLGPWFPVFSYLLILYYILYIVIFQKLNCFSRVLVRLKVLSLWQQLKSQVSLIHKWFRVLPQIQEKSVYRLRGSLTFVAPKPFPVWFFKPERLCFSIHFSSQYSTNCGLPSGFEPENSACIIPSFQMLILFQNSPSFHRSSLPIGSWFCLKFIISLRDLVQQEFTQPSRIEILFPSF